MLKFLVANDNGNSEQDLYINHEGIYSPNVLAKVPRLPNLDEVDIKATLADIHNNLIVTINGTNYYIGSYAQSSGYPCRSIQVGVDNDKVSSKIVFVNTLAHIAGEAVKQIVATQPVLQALPVEVAVDMTTALPISYYSAETARAFEQVFLGKHEVGVHVGSFIFPVTITFEFIKCIPEGVTAAHALLNMEHLTTTKGVVLSHDDIMKARILHVAIGEGTTEFPLTYDGILFRPDFIQGTNNGVGHAIDRVIQPFKRSLGLLRYTRQDFMDAVRNPAHKYHQDAVNFLLPALEDEAIEILQVTEQMISAANNDVDIVAVYGGGSILIRDYLKKHLQGFCDRARIHLVYIEDENTAVRLEAMGLDSFVHSQIFQALKKKSS